MQTDTLNPGLSLENCLKCSLCVDVCPMKAVNPIYPGPKQAGPDEERYRIRSPYYYDYLLKFCLNCKRCEVACPSNVKIADIIQRAKLDSGKSSHPLRDFMLASTDLVGSIATPLAPAANPILSTKLAKGAMDALLGVDHRRTFPAYAWKRFTTEMKSRPQDSFARRVSYFHGCYVQYNFPDLGLDLVKVLNACGVGVDLLRDEKCCGVAMMANGFKRKSLSMARHNIRILTGAASQGRTILTTSSTCTFTMREEYRHVLGLDTDPYRDHLMLATRWLYEEIEAGRIKLAFKEGIRRKVAYHTACHMQKLGWQIFSIRMLRMIPGLQTVVLDQECCGISGTFGFKKENYDFSQAISSKLADSIARTGAEEVCTDCETCKWQIEMSCGVKVLNPISILAQSLDIEKTRELNK